MTASDVELWTGAIPARQATCASCQPLAPAAGKPVA
jgi:hypothetical protein